ncbi:hypothetical protein A3Q56_05772 [Intoshia linei]|uniref:STIL N-terminal domain-containing protein n=1 Tax=Intoshia linei TaxID=1819745 RepID=A0A177AWY3_9BILA|nr:hypothetical protein A3Q56_05772 [Intoshia linei]
MDYGSFIEFPITRSILWHTKAVNPEDSPQLIYNHDFLLEMDYRLLRNIGRLSSRLKNNDNYEEVILMSSVEYDNEANRIKIIMDRMEVAPYIDDMYLSENDLVPPDVYFKCSIKKTSNVDQMKDFALQELLNNCSGQAFRGNSHNYLIASKGRIIFHKTFEEGLNRDINSFHIDFYLIAPRTIFSLVKILSPTIVTTPLSKSLLSPSQCVRYGYLSMDKSRNIIMLMSEDIRTKEVPLVGVWVCGVKSLQDCFVWNIFLKYWYSLNIKKANKTNFLLLLTLADKSITFYDVKLKDPAESHDLKFSLYSCHTIVNVNMVKCSYVNLKTDFRTNDKETLDIPFVPFKNTFSKSQTGNDLDEFHYNSSQFIFSDLMKKLNVFPPKKIEKPSNIPYLTSRILPCESTNSISKKSSFYRLFGECEPVNVSFPRRDVSAFIDDIHSTICESETNLKLKMKNVNIQDNDNENSTLSHKNAITQPIISDQCDQEKALDLSYKGKLENSEKANSLSSFSKGESVASVDNYKKYLEDKIDSMEATMVELFNRHSQQVSDLKSQVDEIHLIQKKYFKNLCRVCKHKLHSTAKVDDVDANYDKQNGDSDSDCLDSNKERLFDSEGILKLENKIEKMWDFYAQHSSKNISPNSSSENWKFKQLDNITQQHYLVDKYDKNVNDVDLSRIADSHAKKYLSLDKMTKLSEMKLPKNHQVVEKISDKTNSVYGLPTSCMSIHTQQYMHNHGLFLDNENSEDKLDDQLDPFQKIPSKIIKNEEILKNPFGISSNSNNENVLPSTIHFQDELVLTSSPKKDTTIPDETTIDNLCIKMLSKVFHVLWIVNVLTQELPIDNKIDIENIFVAPNPIIDSEDVAVTKVLMDLNVTADSKMFPIINALNITQNVSNLSVNSAEYHETFALWGLSMNILHTGESAFLRAYSTNNSIQAMETCNNMCLDRDNCNVINVDVQVNTVWGLDEFLEIKCKFYDCINYPCSINKTNPQISIFGFPWNLINVPKFIKNNSQSILNEDINFYANSAKLQQIVSNFKTSIMKMFTFDGNVTDILDVDLHEKYKRNKFISIRIANSTDQMHIYDFNTTLVMLTMVGFVVLVLSFGTIVLYWTFSGKLVKFPSIQRYRKC